MSVVKDICNLLKNQRVLLGLGVLVVLAVVVSLYSKQLGLSLSPMSNQDQIMKINILVKTDLLNAAGECPNHSPS